MTDKPREQRRARGRVSADTDTAPAPSLEEILDAALRLFGEKGFDGASIRDLSRSLEVSHNLVNVRVGTKRQLWEAAVAQGMQQLRSTIVGAATSLPSQIDVQERMRVVLCAFLQATYENPSTLKVMNVEGAQGGDRLEFIVDHYLDFALTPLRELLEEGIKSGTFQNVSFSTFFLLVAHGGGALLCLAPLTARIDELVGTTTTTPDTRISEVVELMLSGITTAATPAKK